MFSQSSDAPRGEATHPRPHSQENSLDRDSRATAHRLWGPIFRRTLGHWGGAHADRSLSIVVMG